MLAASIYEGHAAVDAGLAVGFARVRRSEMNLKINTPQPV